MQNVWTFYLQPSSLQRPASFFSSYSGKCPYPSYLDSAAGFLSQFCTLSCASLTDEAEGRPRFGGALHKISFSATCWRNPRRSNTFFFAIPRLSALRLYSNQAFSKAISNAWDIIRKVHFLDLMCERYTMLSLYNFMHSCRLTAFLLCPHGGMYLTFPVQ